MEIYRTIVGNTSPDQSFTLKRNGTVINLTGATITLAIQKEWTGETTNTGQQSTTITDAVNGVISYTPKATDYPVEGRYIAQAKIVFLTSKVEFIPEQMLVLADNGVS